MKIKYLNKEEFDKANEARMNLAKTRTDGKQGASLYEITGPGVGWYSYWYFDPTSEEDRQQARLEKHLELIAQGEKMNFLSKFYWLEWSKIRSPISVLCPNGMEWCIDQVSSNGEGWKVTGSLEEGNLTASPSIDVKGYHGWLGINGAEPGSFSKDLDKRGDTGYGVWPY